MKGLQFKAVLASKSLVVSGKRTTTNCMGLEKVALKVAFLWNPPKLCVDQQFKLRKHSEGGKLVGFTLGTTCFMGEEWCWSIKVTEGCKGQACA